MFDNPCIKEIEKHRKGTKIDKAQAYDKDVDYLLGEVQRLTNENRLFNTDKDRLKLLERLEMAVMSVGYSRGHTADAS